jgi:hypothetical protein
MQPLFIYSISAAAGRRVRLEETEAALCICMAPHARIPSSPRQPRHCRLCPHGPETSAPSSTPTTASELSATRRRRTTACSQR